AQAFLGEHQVNRCALGLVGVAAVLKRDAHQKLAGGRHVAGLGAGMGVLRDVFMQAVHVLPAAALALLVAKQREPGGDIKIAGTAGGRVGHDDLALVDRLGQVLPALGFGDVLFLGLDR